MMHKFFRKKRSMPGLLQELKSFFQTITEPVIRKGAIPLVDGLLSGLAIFSLKYPSLLQFDKSRNEPVRAHNLKTLYGIKTSPSDTYLRERLDERARSLRTPRGIDCPNKTSPTWQSIGAV
jgi:hypothetical protein